uniref:Uncharacterized protein n=1 Tax=Tetranychus urticae TaxID=32264 RepID=T1JQS9_TETUR
MELLNEIFNKIIKENLTCDTFCDTIEKDKESVIKLIERINECDCPATMVTLKGATSNNLKGILLIYVMMAQKSKIEFQKVNQLLEAVILMETCVKSALTLRKEQIQGIIDEKITIGVIIYEDTWVIPDVIQRNVQAKWRNISTKWKTLLRLNPLDQENEIKEILGNGSSKALVVITGYHLAQQSNTNDGEVQQRFENYLEGFGNTNHWLYTKVYPNNDHKNYVFLKKEIYLKAFKEGIQIGDRTLFFDIVAKYTICKKCGQPKTCNHPPKHCSVPEILN